MKVLLPIVIILMIAATPAHAGKNAGGAMIVHTSNTYTYSSQTVCTTAAGDPGTCESANTLATKPAGQVVWLLAAFPQGSSPGVSVVYFGIDYHADLDPGSGYRACGPAGTLEVPDNGWPYTGRGNAVAFGSPIVGDLLFPFYAFRIDGGTAGSFFGTTINPTGGYAAFVDDNPADPVLDYCTRFGTVRWHVAGSNNCPVDSPGACCFDDGSCRILFVTDCWEEDGVFQGLDTTCEPNPCPPPQVCCNIQTQECRFIPPERCWDLGEFWEAVNPEDAESCAEAPCAKGACCLANGWCEVRQRYSCTRSGGEFQGEGTTCEPNPCPVPGACCLPDGTCLILLDWVCADHGGIFQGESTSCDPNPCLQPPEGACCIGAVCFYTTESYCNNAGGVYQGDDTGCVPNPCGGACCLEGALCSIRVEWDCYGTFLGNGTTCEPDPCPRACCKPDGDCAWMFRMDCLAVGGTVIDDPFTVCYDSPCDSLVACCFPDGSCRLLEPALCESEGGIPQGPGVVCVPDPCAPVPTGACCLEDGFCVVLDRELCEQAGGQYQGDGVPCEPDPCAPPVPVQTTTWGKIKSKYR